MLVFASLIMFSAWAYVSKLWKRKIEWYLIPFSTVSLIILVEDTFLLEPVGISIVLLYAVFNLWLYHYRQWTIATIIPLSAVLFMWAQLYGFAPKYLMLPILFVGFLVSSIVGRVLFTQLYRENSSSIWMDWYSVTAVLYLACMMWWLDSSDSVWIEIIPLIAFTLWVFSQVSRVEGRHVQKGFITFGAVSVFAPYYVVLEAYILSVPELIHAELIALPWLALAIALSVKTWSMYKKPMHYVQLIVLVLVTTYLTVDALYSNTIWDAVIMGTLSLVSIIAGMQLKIKSYFFVGVTVLLLNVFIQTKPYWGQLPWWAYLLIAGSTLIAIASYNEWQKQKSDQNEKPLVQRKVKKLVVRLKEWD
ncbi:hypothetical protein [Pontibacillus yanchengensis]|uniref:Uncharacterized protein n=1 Tax=Pontibacillus yanchengensis Y32 TaxID=1385514 RepID=A0A0A2T614_9BACI|nr:hypothetical protein [Pontibacillus yanchengensis]KGP70919.1 hypothetical protein N782_02830 [Pontibacillus yanchengensis Y32]